MKTTVCDRCLHQFDYDPVDNNNRMYELRLKSWMVSCNPEKKLKSKSIRLVLCRKCYADLCSWVSLNQQLLEKENK